MHRALSRRLFIPTTHDQTEFDITNDGQPGEQRGLLKHDASIQPRTLDRPTVEQHLATGGTHEARDDLQEGAFAATARTQNAEELVAAHRQVEMVERVIPADLALIKMIDVDRVNDRKFGPSVARLRGERFRDHHCRPTPCRLRTIPGLNFGFIL